MSYSELSNQQQIFIDKYLESMDGRQASIDAGFDRKEANKISLELLTNSTIQDAIAERQEELNKIVATMRFDKEDLIRIYWNMYNDARKKGRLADAKSILKDIADYNGIKPDEVKKEIAILNFNIDGDKI